MAHVEIGRHARHDAAMRRVSRLLNPRSPWEPTHHLRWVPRAGIVLEWLVRLDVKRVDGREVATAKALEEEQVKLPAAWVRTDGTWTHNGRIGFLSRDGAVQLVPI